MRRFRGALVALVACAFAIISLQVLPWPGDFAPFVMTITGWSSARVGFSDGRTLPGTSVSRLDYRDRDNWTITLVSDDIVGWSGAQTPDAHACWRGVYGHVDLSSGALNSGQWTGPCPAPNRWIGYGIAWAVPWDKTISKGVITYTSTGERVAFDMRTGMPLEYEAGISPFANGHTLMTYKVEQR
jgi:hypothetical protein